MWSAARRALLWVIAVTALGVMTSCFTDLQDASCVSDAECFVGETCVDGTCQQGASSTSTNNATNTNNATSTNNTTSTTNNSTTGGEVLVSVRGQVVDIAGDPIARIRIETEPESEPALTDADGMYKLEITSAFGTVYQIRPSCVEARLPCGELEAQSITFQSQDIRDVDFIIELECRDTELFCDGIDDDCNGQVDDEVRNACTGCEPFEFELGAGCGVCSGGGFWACATEDALKCTTQGRPNDPERGNEGDDCEGKSAQFCMPGVCDPDTNVCAPPEGGCQ